MDVLFFRGQGVHFYDPCTGFARIELFIPACFAAPPAAQDALPQFGKREGGITEIAYIP